jgi:hypothetical protein
MVAHPFCCLKIGHFKATVRTVSPTIDVKTGSPDPANFAKTRRLLPQLWQIAQSPLAYHTEAAARSHKQWRELPTFAILFFVRTATSI